MVGDDGGDPLPDAFQPGHRVPVSEVGAGVGGGVGHGAGQGVHAAAGEVHAGDRVHVRDDGVRGERAGGGDTGVQGLEGEDAPQSFVGEEAADTGVQPAEAAERGQPGQVGG
ncbi:hypothetical protein GCM10020256_71190 [Streptomyces thermocoprophilus]